MNNVHFDEIRKLPIVKRVIAMNRIIVEMRIPVSEHLEFYARCGVLHRPLYEVS